jgi:tetratricopeptide (TPR) repeat protein
MLKDRYGNLMSTSSQSAVGKFNHACELMRLYRGDPIAAIDAALEDDPDCAMAWAARAGVLVQQEDKVYLKEAERSIRAGGAAKGNERERAHLAAAQLWLEGRIHDATVAFARIAQDHPRDLVAIQAAHLGCFYTGRQSELRDWPVQALRAFRNGDDGYHAVLGMAAFGCEECGDYARADALGRKAVELDPRDAWAVHAVAHVNEMRGDVNTGIPWLRHSADSWAPDCGFAFHNWWHLALLHLDGGNIAEVLKLYDTKVRRDDPSALLLEWIDASALLWRLKLEGVDVGTRWDSLAKSWERATEDGYYAFNDLHAIMAFLGAGRSSDLARTLAAMKRAAAENSDNGYMTRAVGLPLAEAFVAFDAGRYAETVEKIGAVRGIAQRFGGSHAQRDVLTLTMLHAALREGMKPLAEALAAERLAHKPESPWARALSQRARAIGTREAA